MIRLLIVDRFRWMCDTMAAVLRDENDIQVVGTATTCDAALAQLPRCNTVLVSSGLPAGGALEIVKGVSTADPTVKSMVVDLPAGDDVAWDYMRAGATAFGFEEDSVEDLLAKLRALQPATRVAGPISLTQEQLL